MAFLPPNKTKAEELLLANNLHPHSNYILASSRMNPVAKSATWLFLSARTSIITNLFEKPYCLVFIKDKIVAIKISGKASVTTYNKSDITNFSVKDGLNSTLIIDFFYRGEPISFYTHKNAGYRIAYSAENLKKLEMDSWRGYLRKTE